MKNRIGVLFATLIAAVMLFAVPVSAKATDEILNYVIRVEVNEDATLNLTYHIDWEVLDSGSVGPLTWMNIGIPNSHADSPVALSETIDHIDLSGNYAKVYLDREYYEGEVVSVDFSIVQDYMYQVDKLREGETVYSFTPGWFDDFEVDNLVILWANDKASAFTPDCSIQDGFNVWEAGHLDPGEKFTVTMSYPNEAYAFDLSKSEDEPNAFVEAIEIILGLIIIFVIMGAFIIVPIVIIYILGRGFSALIRGGDTVKKITRVKVTYYDSCPGCGAPRKEGTKFCEYCGKSLVKSEETITEEQLKKEEKDAVKFTRNGEYQYGSSPNVFIRVNTIRVPNPHPVTGTSSRGGGHISHSSCAHSSCACACACACAGGGRAGCSSKDFYRDKITLDLSR